ncbi:hypothetical protein XF35_10065 [Streptomyces platensis subsp. clarensis]|nr:hypothetical protein [Streptomyces platensis subsp. clarensis]
MPREAVSRTVPGPLRSTPDVPRQPVTALPVPRHRAPGSPARPEAAWTTTAVMTRPARTAQRPSKPVSTESPSCHPGTRSRAVKVPSYGSKERNASSNSSGRPVIGNQALYTDSLALNSTRSQGNGGAP